jgi:signal transduction histidine kinase
MRIQQKVDIREEKIPDHLKIVIFRILQEAMNNIAKHSQGKAVVLALEKKNEGDLHGGEMAGGLKNKRIGHRA